MRRTIRRLAAGTSGVVGSAWGFALASLAAVVWLAWGIFDRFSNRWLLVPSAVASVLTLLIAFGLQHTQNRDTRAIQLKLDEILRASADARTELVKLERLDDEHLARIEEDLLQRRGGD